MRGSQDAEVEVIYAVRRRDGNPIDDYSFCVVDGPNDWTPAKEDREWATDPAEFELVKMVVTVVATKSFPECADLLCDEVASFWGLCAKHAEADDPEIYAQMVADRAVSR